MAECGLEHEKDDFSNGRDWRFPVNPTPMRLSIFGLKHDEDFPPNFKEYATRELKWSQLEISGKPGGYEALPFWKNRDWQGIRWVFWSQQDDDSGRPLSYGK